MSVTGLNSHTPQITSLHEVTRQAQQPLDSGMGPPHAEFSKPRQPDYSKRASGLRRRTCSALGAHDRYTSGSSTDVVYVVPTPAC